MSKLLCNVSKFSGGGKCPPWLRACSVISKMNTVQLYPQAQQNSRTDRKTP